MTEPSPESSNAIFVDTSPPPEGGRRLGLVTTLFVLLAPIPKKHIVLGFVIGSVVLMIAGSDCDYTEYARFTGERDTATGVVRNVVPLGEFKSGKGDDATRYRVDFDFVTPLDEVIQAQSFTREQPEVWSKISVEYPAGKPVEARAVGMQTRPYGGELVFAVLLFPLLATLGFFWHLRKGFRNLRVLRRGVVTTATIASSDSSVVEHASRDQSGRIASQSRRRQWHHSLKFTDAEGKQHEVNHTARIPVGEDGDNVRIMYVPGQESSPLVWGTSLLDRLDGQLPAAGAWLFALIMPKPVVPDVSLTGDVERIPLTRLTNRLLIPGLALGVFVLLLLYGLTAQPEYLVAPAWGQPA